jgi:hypothetical protein
MPNLKLKRKINLGVPLRVGLSALSFVFLKKKKQKDIASIPNAAPVLKDVFRKI